MPRCNGLPDGPYPHNKCSSSVNLSQEDLMLCKHCSNVRFPAQAVTAANSVKSLETGNGPDKECMPGMSIDDANNVVIRQLPDLNSVADGKYDDVFIRSLNTIYQYSLRDIQDQLQKASMKVLTVLHKALCDKVRTNFSQYKDRRVINRQVKHTIVPDIFNLGYSLVNKSSSNELDKIFVNKDESLAADKLQAVLDKESWSQGVIVRPFRDQENSRRQGNAWKQKNTSRRIKAAPTFNRPQRPTVSYQKRSPEQQPDIRQQIRNEDYHYNTPWAAPEPWQQRRQHGVDLEPPQWRSDHFNYRNVSRDEYRDNRGVNHAFTRPSTMYIPGGW